MITDYVNNEMRENQVNRDDTKQMVISTHSFHHYLFHKKAVEDKWFIVKVLPYKNVFGPSCTL